MSELRANQRGIALVLVLWVVTLLTIIAVSLTTAQRTESILARNQLDTLRFRAAAEAGISWAVLNLLAPPTIFEEEESTVWVPDGTARSWTFAGETLEIQVFNESSRIDLNTASQDLLTAMLTATGISEDEAAALADAIEDWRDTNDLAELNGAEDGDYEEAGRPYGAKDGPFETVEELQLVLGFDRDLYRTLAPALTVDAGDTDTNPDFAPPLVRAALQGISLEQEELEREQREALVGGDISEPAHVDRGGPVYRIRITATTQDGPGLSMEALINIQPGNGSPYIILWRRFGLVAAGPETAIEGDYTDTGER